MTNKTLDGKRITFRVDGDTREKGERIAKRRGATLSELAREGFTFIINIKNMPKQKKTKTVKGYAIIEIRNEKIYDVCPKKPKFRGDEYYKVIPITITYKI